MDDHYQQPIWPMLQGAVDYALNIAGEIWSMIWISKPELRAVPVIAQPAYDAKHVAQVVMATASTGISDHQPDRRYLSQDPSRPIKK
ncbi:hypothetical protein IAQ61_003955 [Plenodomus lingam]|uniref:Uncharacterized protein n=1 Tax=Leptosphaeria maculans (strain JN3 / isolate v23.1.3 / race Av1-4-5-6-7-8) TaxID=985895 RepID=E4ZQS9_LEPMJ|nr:hypothetical protein LEMA_uP037580.1 [Plenodomus lingam JN3]KAH9874765.1 hypothetical protein IAQ61_003955 [Plenodomus lingam]CBX94084.1 hypothetical protein LEMA_uP037580.1 [Plenodomus lingam JN3]